MGQDHRVLAGVSRSPDDPRMTTSTSDSYQPMTPDGGAQIAAISEPLTLTRIEREHSLGPDNWDPTQSMILGMHVEQVAKAALALAVKSPTSYHEDERRDRYWSECVFCSVEEVEDEKTGDLTLDHTADCAWNSLVRTIAGEPR